MKKLILICLSALLLAGCTNIAKSDSNNFDILTLFSSSSNTQNRLWVGTFQLVFNDFKNNIVKHDVIFEGEKPTPDLIGLNRGDFTSDMLDMSSYYTRYGNTSYEEKAEIEKALLEKFNIKSDILDNFDWSEGIGRYYAYAMLKKDFEFLKEFDKLGKFSFNNSEEKHEFFGIDKKSKSELYKNVKVLFYNGKNDYAIELLTKTNDIIYLYRTECKDSFDKIYKKMMEKGEKYKGERIFTASDTLKIPNLKFKNERKYKELCNKRIVGSDISINEALETIQLELNSKGGHVKSEAIIMTKNAIMPMEKEVIPREFNFDKTFTLFLVDKGKNNPYLAMQIADLDKFIE